MSFLRELLGSISVPKVEKKLTGIDEIARTWGRYQKPRGPNSYIGGPQAHEAVQPEPVSPEEVLREQYWKRMGVYQDVRDYDPVLRAHSRIPENLGPRPGRQR